MVHSILTGKFQVERWFKYVSLTQRNLTDPFLQLSLLLMRGVEFEVELEFPSGNCNIDLQLEKL